MTSPLDTVTFSFGFLRLFVMSWFLSQFSNFKFPPPADSVPPQTTRILEEPPRPQGPIPNQEEKSNIHLQQPTNQPERSKLLFGAGLSFFALSLIITRRSFTRRRLAIKPSFYTNAPAHHVEQSGKVSGAMEAVEALNVATINVLSLAMMALGGSMWYYNINSIADARRFVRGGLGVDGTGRSEQDAEEEFEEWMATVLARKEVKEESRRT